MSKIGMLKVGGSGLVREVKKRMDVPAMSGMVTGRDVKVAEGGKILELMKGEREMEEVGVSRAGVDSAWLRAVRALAKKSGHIVRKKEFLLLREIRRMVRRGERPDIRKAAIVAGYKKGELLAVEETVLWGIPEDVYNAVVAAGEREFETNLHRLMNDEDPKVCIAAMRLWAEVKGKGAVAGRAPHLSKFEIGPVENLNMKK